MYYERDSSYGDHRYHGDPNRWTPVRLTLMRWLTVLTFLAVTLQVWTWGQEFNQRASGFDIRLTDKQVVQCEEIATGVINRVRELGRNYSIAEYAPDMNALLGLDAALEEFGGISSVTASPATGRRVDLRLVQLSKLSNYARETARSTVEANIVLTGEKRPDLVAGPVVRAYMDAHPDNWPPFLPPDPTPPLPINWRNVAKHGIDGWLLAMIPAFLTIIVGFRLRRESLWAELIERPWMVVGAAALWPVGLWGYVGQPGIIERRLQQLVRDYEDVHHERPSQEWMAAERLVLMRRARNAQEALAQIREYPELIRVNSRGAILASWLFAMASGPMQMMIGVAQAYALVARTGSGVDSAQVDQPRTSRRRNVSSRTFGVMTYNGDRGFNLGTLWGIGKLREGRVKADAWVDFMAPKVMQASATYAATPAIGIEAGRIWTPVVYSLPGPDNGIFPGGSLGGYFPSGSGDGIAVHADTKFGSAVASVQSGLNPEQSDVSLFGQGRAWLVKFFGGIHRGSQEFQFGQVEATWHGLTLREMVVMRPDQDRSAAGTDIVYQHGSYRGGIHLEHDRWQASAECKFDVHSRMVLHVGQTDGVNGTSIIGKVQYGFALAP